MVAFDTKLRNHQAGNRFDQRDFLRTPLGWYASPLFWGWILSQLLTSFPTFGHWVILESGEPTSPQQLELGIAPMITLNNRPGGNGLVWGKLGLEDGKEILLQVGGGQIDHWFLLGGRWVPIPDFDQQPSLGLRFDATLSRDDGISYGVVRLCPFVSKLFRAESGALEPYLYLPIGFQIQEGGYKNPFQLVAGSQLIIEDLRPVRLYMEVGFNLRDSPTFISVGVTSEFNLMR